MLLMLVVAGQLVAGGGPRAAAAQDQPRSRIGLAHIGAIGMHVGAASIEHSADGFEGGAWIDLGWIRTPRIRLQGEVSFLRGSLTEFVRATDSTFSGAFYDLTSSVDAVVLMRDPAARVVPYLAAGVGVHALSSAFGDLSLDRRYNTNPFGSHAAAGLRVSLSASGRNAISLELRTSLAENVNRTSARVGGMVLFGDLIRPRRR
jgi:hypothetical protein